MKAQPAVAAVDIWRLLRLTLIVFGLELAFVAGWWAGYTAAGWKEAKRPRPANLWFACPRHPGYQSSERGNCPIDGFRLEPVHEDQTDPAAGKKPSGSLGPSLRRSQRGEKSAARYPAHPVRPYHAGAVPTEEPDGTSEA
jgi:hypothetical protein